MKQRFKLMLGDNIESLKKIPDNSIDSVVTDPPYGLSAPKNSGKTSKGGFMNKKWDYDVPSVQFWKEVYRVLKPGGHIVSFGGTRTYHRMVVNIEDAGFEIRDQIQWIYGMGFTKSLNVKKQLEKNGKKLCECKKNTKHDLSQKDGVGNYCSECGEQIADLTLGHTALKPANEPICLARKPLSEKSVAENILKWKTGGINVDGCRVGNESISSGKSKVVGGGQLNGENTRVDIEETFTEGRFPANIILECICDEVIKGEKGEVIESNGSRKDCDLSHEWGYKEIKRTIFTDKGDIHTNPMCPCRLLDEQSLSSSRFFYQAKVSKAERNMGLDGFEEKTAYVFTTNGVPSTRANTHPTVKPINLMTYLCRLITPKNGIILDPFVGSGSTGIAAQLEGFRFVGMEMDEEYMKIATARIENYEKYRKFLK